MTPKSQPPAKPVKAWAIVDAKGIIVEIAITSRNAAWVRLWSWHHYCPVCDEEHKLFLNALEYFKDYGYACIRVLITPQ